MTTSKIRLLWISVLLVALSALPAFAAAGVRMVRLSRAQGDVQIDRNAGDGWEQAINNMPVIGGARIYAAEGAKAELEFEDGGSLRLVGPAQLSLLELSVASDGSLVNEVQVDSGTVYAKVQLHHHDTFRISGPTGESFVLTQPSKLRFTVDQQTASLAMMQGEAVAQTGESNSKIGNGETYNYVLGQPESAARLESVPAQPEDSWDQQRDSYADQYSSSGAENSGSEDPNGYGVADLGYYGSYSDVPGYGVLWRPTGFDIGWDPFAYGAWSFYPGWGWTFVSGYNWGWAPFYYGDWRFVGGRGWCWHPGGGWGRPRSPNRNGGGGGFHPQPRWSGAPARGWNSPRPPARASHGTVAVAGSHLVVGSIAATHQPNAGHGFVAGNAGTPIARPIARNGSMSNVSRSSAPLNPGLVNSGIVGQKGSYSLSGSASGRNGIAVHRPSTGYASRPGSYTSRSGGLAPRSGGILAGRSGNGSAVHDVPGTSLPRTYGFAGPSAPRTFSVPPTSMQRAPSSPSVSSAPHVSSGSAAGGGGASPRGGGAGFSSGGGGGSHGGGGHR